MDFQSSPSYVLKLKNFDCNSKERTDFLQIIQYICRMFELTMLLHLEISFYIFLPNGRLFRESALVFTIFIPANPEFFVPSDFL